VFPGQFIIDEQQMAFSRQLGDLETTVAVHRRDYMPRLDVDVADISNLNHKNQVRTKDDRFAAECAGQSAVALRQQLQAHSRPLSLLSARTIPDEGGETQFADMRAGWDALPDRMKARLEGLICEHTQLFSRALIGLTDWLDEERAKMAPVTRG
jgi:alpha-ketoglutarate-dependent 2,4-dichlorophenoxyacetate dioxygenase